MTNTLTATPNQQSLTLQLCNVNYIRSIFKALHSVIQIRSCNVCSNRLLKALLMSHCRNAFIDIHHPHFLCAHLRKIDIAVEAHINTKQISFSFFAHVKSGIHSQVASHSIFTFLHACCVLTHTHRHTHIGKHTNSIAARQGGITRDVLQLAQRHSPETMETQKQRERVWCVYLPLRISSAHQPHTV